MFNGRPNPSKLTTADDADLLAACGRGEQRAWDALIDRYGRLVYSIPRQFRMSDSDAEDVFQTVFAALLKNIDRIDRPERLSSWLITTARRECMRLIRASKRERAADAADHMIDDPDEVRDMTARLEQQHLVRTAMARLEERDRNLLTALFKAGGGGDYESIASKLGIPVGSIGPTRARAFKKLERILLELGFDAESNGYTSAPGAASRTAPQSPRRGPGINDDLAAQRAARPSIRAGGPVAPLRSFATGVSLIAAA